jgi:hypothetical protein
MVEICGTNGAVHFRLPDGHKELELKLRAVLQREEELEAAVEAERERVTFLLDAISRYLYELRNYPESAAAKWIELDLAAKRAGGEAFSRRGTALYDLFRELEAMGADSLSLEVLAAFQAARHIWYRP